MPQGTISKVRAFSDFFGAVENLGLGAVGTPANTFTVDEPGGILSLVCGDVDDDNVFVVAQGFKPADGPIFMEARFKLADITKGAINVGFTSQTTVLAASTFVLPVEFATATATTNDADAAVFFYDIDATTDVLRFMTVKDNVDGAITTLAAPVNDTWLLFRVEIDPTGDCRAFLDGSLISSREAACDTTATYHAIVAYEARAITGASPVEVDYLLASGNRDWTV